MTAQRSLLERSLMRGSPAAEILLPPANPLPKLAALDRFASGDPMSGIVIAACGSGDTLLLLRGEPARAGVEAVEPVLDGAASTSSATSSAD